MSDAKQPKVTVPLLALKKERVKVLTVKTSVRTGRAGTHPTLIGIHCCGEAF